VPEEFVQAVRGLIFTGRTNIGCHFQGTSSKPVTQVETLGCSLKTLHGSAFEMKSEK
jgi:hypothetical protein